MLKGYTKSCEGKKLAGVKKFGLIAAANISAVAYDTTDEDAIKSITLKASEMFKQFQFAENECEFQENYKVENDIQTVEQKVIFKLTAMTPETRAAVEEIALASGCGAIGALTTSSGKTVIIGWDNVFDGERPLRLQSTTGTTGKKTSDASGEEITMGRETAVKAHYYVGDVEALYGAASV